LIDRNFVDYPDVATAQVCPKLVDTVTAVPRTLLQVRQVVLLKNGHRDRKDGIQAWYAEFLLEMDLKILLRKTGARLNFKIALISLHIDPGL
jgi:hypothetical protein